MDKVRDVESLKNVNTATYMDSIKKNDIDLFENEYALLGDSIGLPPAFMQLEIQLQQMLLLYLDNDYIEPNSMKPTKDSAFISFLATYPNQNVVKKIYKTVEVAIGTDMDGNAITKDIKVLDDEEMPLYLKLKAMASGMWKKYNLKELVKSMREIITNDGFKDEELLERGIVDDALAKDKTNYTARMRALAIKVKGMEKTNALQQINVYVEGGGKQLNKTIIESSGNDNYDLGIEED